MKKTGYSSKFLQKSYSLPRLTGKKYSKQLKFTHFSIFQQLERKLPVLSAVNIDGKTFQPIPSAAGDGNWDYANGLDSDPKKNRAQQIGEELYGNDANLFDRGHLVKRIDPCWGTKAVAMQAESDTFTWVNCTPQHKDLNQSKGLWHQLEDHILEKGVQGKNEKVTVLAGPVLDKNDPYFTTTENKKYQIPLVFWKIVLYEKGEDVAAVGFMMGQYEFIKAFVSREESRRGIVAPQSGFKELPDDYFEKLKFTNQQVCQVKIEKIEQATGIRFGFAKAGILMPYQEEKDSALTSISIPNSKRKMAANGVAQLPTNRRDNYETIYEIKGMSL